MNNELKGWTRSRPVRVAFLVQDGEIAHRALDGIFADCYGRWGGRFSLIVPCTDNRVSPAYWQLLEIYDPDIVYSYVPLSIDSIRDLNERLAPLQYKEHKAEKRDDIFGHKPTYGFEPLSSLSTIFRLARHGVPLKIVDHEYASEPTRFFSDNVGAYHIARGSGVFPADARNSGGLLTVVAAERNNPRHGYPPTAATVPDELSALRKLAEKSAVGLSQLSALYAPRLEIYANRWRGAFNLVVGESFADRIIFWNARLFIPRWLDGDLCCFRVDLEQLRDRDFLEILTELIRNHNHVNGGSGGQTLVTVRSASLDSESLTEAANFVRAAQTWSGVHHEAIEGLDAVLPEVRELSQRNEEIYYGGGVFRNSGWSKFNWESPLARLPLVPPEHLSDAPVGQMFADGHWCSDVSLEYEGPGPRFGDGTWQLPSRWRMASAFNVTFRNESSLAQLPVPRRNRGGSLSILESAGNPIDRIEVPNVKTAIRHAFAAWSIVEPMDVYPHRGTKAYLIEESNEARYLAGILGMAGGLDNATRFLLHPFLQKIFSELGGTPTVALNKVAPTLNRLRKRAQIEPAFDISNESERSVLANLIVKASRELRSPREYIRYHDMRERWREHRAVYWTQNPQPAHDTSVDWDGMEMASLDTCLIEMRKRQMVFQGHNWTCTICHHRNWVDIASVSPQFSCEVCKGVVPAPVDIEWSFRPSEFLIESLRDHSVLSLIWVLAALRERARQSFMFVEPTCFTFEPERQSPEAESDLLVIADRKTYLCEVKSSWSSVRQFDIESLARLASKLRPDVALFAVMDHGLEHSVAAASAKSSLASEGIAFEFLNLDRFTYRDDPYLDRS